jgi:hypothetical protein
MDVAAESRNFPALPATPETTASQRAQPRFADAVRRSAVGLLELHRGGRLLKWIMDDRGRMLFGYSAAYLHFSHDPADPSSGLTPTRMKALCAELGICSAGRAIATFSLMRAAGYLAPDPHVGDRRRRRYLATSQLVDSVMERCHLHIAAMAPLFPDGEALLSVSRNPLFTRRVITAMAAHYRSGFRFMTPAPSLRLFADRNAGMLLLCHLITTGAPDETVPPSRPVPISVSALARRFGVSRPHVVKLVRDAADAGLIGRVGDDGDQLVIKPALADALLEFFAGMYLQFAAAAREALAAMDAGS